MICDIVITWVDWSDKNLIKTIIQSGGRSEGCESGDFIELKYLIRSLVKYNIGVNNIYIVYSDSHPPPKYLKETDNLKFVPHSLLVDKKEHLPLIHRESIVSHLHKIPNLSRYYFYFQDDLFIMNKNVLNDVIDKYNNNEIYVNYKYNMKDKYDVSKSCGLWFQSTINSERLFKKKTDKSIIFEHSIQFFDKNIIYELEKLYPKQFYMTQTYKNYKTETEKEEFIICITCMFNNYLIYKQNYKPIEYDTSKITQIHTNDMNLKKPFQNQIKIYKMLNNLSNTWILNAQGPGISDEYEKDNTIHNLFYSFLDYKYPNKTKYENPYGKKIGDFKVIKLTINLIILFFVILFFKKCIKKNLLKAIKT